MCFSPIFEHLDKEKQPVGGGWEGHRWIFCGIWAVNCHPKLWLFNLSYSSSSQGVLHPHPPESSPAHHTLVRTWALQWLESLSYEKSQFLLLCYGKVSINNVHLEHSLPSGCAAFCRALREIHVFLVNIKERAGVKAVETFVF